MCLRLAKLPNVRIRAAAWHHPPVVVADHRAHLHDLAGESPFQRLGGAGVNVAVNVQVRRGSHAAPASKVGGETLGIEAALKAHLQSHPCNLCTESLHEFFWVGLLELTYLPCRGHIIGLRWHALEGVKAPELWLDRLERFRQHLGEGAARRHAELIDITAAEEELGGFGRLDPCRPTPV